MSRYVWVMTLLLAAAGVWAQEPARLNSVQLELGGSGLLYSLGYERIVGQVLAAKAGISFVQVQERGTSKYFQMGTLPLTTSFLWHIWGQQHYAELGGGANVVWLSSTMNSYARETDLYFNPLLNIAYRFHAGGGRWLYRVAFTPFYGRASSTDNRANQQAFSPLGRGVQWWGGVAVGYRF